MISIDTAPVSGIHPGRLAVEQLFGYMVRNAKTHGILTTMKGWCFLWRQNGGRLYMTRMYGDFPIVPNVSPGPLAEGYCPTTNFSIMKALYFMSNLAQRTPDVPETPINGQPGEVYLPFAILKGSAEAAPTIEQPQAPVPMPTGQGGWQRFRRNVQGYHVVGDYESAVDFFQYHEGVDYTSLLFEPWIKANYLGPKNWIATVLSDQSKVVLKLWDAWKFDVTDRDHEANIYKSLQSLWGKHIPFLRVSTPLEYFHALILQYVEAWHVSSGYSNDKAYPVSSANLTSQAEKEIMMAFDAIHALGVVHGDIRAENILVTEDGNSAWIIDFEYSEILPVEEIDSRSTSEKETVADLLATIRSGGRWMN